MRILLDTHAFIWFIFADPKLSSTAADIIGDPNNERLLGMASIWEISIKEQTGKLAMPNPLDQFLNHQLFVNRIQLLPIKFSHAIGVHALQYARLPNGAEHRDPFDRLIVSQATIEDFPIVSIEPVFEQYGVKRIW